MIGSPGMADNPWWSSLIGVAVGSILTIGGNLLTDLRKDLALSRQKRADADAEEKKEEAKQDWYWRQQAMSCWL
jgi:hypothetical protein